MTNTDLLLNIIENIDSGNFDDAHDDAFDLPNKPGRKIQLAIQTDRISEARCIANMSLGRI